MNAYSSGLTLPSHNPSLFHFKNSLFIERDLCVPVRPVFDFAWLGEL